VKPCTNPISCTVEV